MTDPSYAMVQPDNAVVKRVRIWVRKLGAAAPLAVAYGTFQVVLTSLPSTLSGDALRELLSVACGVATGGITGCAALWISRSRLVSNAAAAAAPAASGPGINVLELSDGTFEAVESSLMRFDDPLLGMLTGWSHFLEESVGAHRRPTAIGTAYGLKLIARLGAPDGRVPRSALADTLWRFQLPDGGWAARTQGRIGRPEVTALVLGALAESGTDPDRLAEAVAVFEHAVTERTDPAVARHTFITTSVVCGLLRVNPGSPALPVLRSRLMAGAILDPAQDNLLCWSDQLEQPVGRPRIPTSVHTARVVLALARMNQAVSDDPAARAAMTQAVRWLVAKGVADNRTEHIRRRSDDSDWEALTHRHFAPSWMVRALVATASLQVPGADELLRAELRRLMAQQTAGVWQWDDGSSPVWMTYQGINALQEFTLARPVDV